MPLVVDTRKAVALLAYVAVVGRPVARDTLTELLWPDADPDAGRAALRRTLSVLRSGLGGRWLVVDRRQVRLGAEDVELDVAVVRGGIQAASHEHDEGDACATCRRALAGATARYRGPFLEGFSLRDSASFDAWQTLEAEALQGELARALVRSVRLESAEARWQEAIEAGRRLVALDPLDERAHRILMRAFAASGDVRAATRQYQECVRILDLELGVGPAPETAALHDALRSTARTATTAIAATGPSAVPAITTGNVLDATAATSASVALDPVATQLLAAAAILGEAVDPDLAGEIAGCEEAAVTAAIEMLVGAGILREPGGGADDAHYRFRDAQVRAAVLDRVGLARRRALHRAAARVLQTRSEATPSSVTLAARIAEHLSAGDRPLDAAHWHRRAADAARRVSAHGLVAEHLRAALGLDERDGADLLAAIGDAEVLRGRYGEALAAYERGAARAEAGAIPAFEQRLGSLHLRRGALELAELHLSAALARLGPGPSPLRARVLTETCLVALRRGDAASAGRLAAASLAEAQASDDPDAEAQAENLLAMLARRAGEEELARTHLRRSLERAGLADDPSTRVGALNNLALLERATGRLETALDLTDEALRRCVLMGDRHREAALRNNRADLLHALGRPREAAEELIRSVSAFVEVGDPPGLEPAIWKLVDW